MEWLIMIGFIGYAFYEWGKNKEIRAREKAESHLRSKMESREKIISICKKNSRT